MGIKWDPFRDLVTFQERLNRIFDVSISEHRHEDGLAGWHPSADVSESETAIQLYIDISGMEIEDIHLQITGNRLIISGERTRPQQRDRLYHQTEILMGAFHRTFILPSTVDPEGIQASYSRGILEITLPKAARPTSHTVPIKIK